MEALDSGHCVCGERGRGFFHIRRRCTPLRRRGRRIEKGGLFFEIDKRCANGWEKRLSTWMPM